MDQRAAAQEQAPPPSRLCQQALVLGGLQEATRDSRSGPRPRPYVVQLTPLGERGQQVMVPSVVIAQVCLSLIAIEL